MEGGASAQFGFQEILPMLFR